MQYRIFHSAALPLGGASWRGGCPGEEILAGGNSVRSLVLSGSADGRV